MPDFKKVHEPPLGLSQPWLTCSHVRVMHTEPRSNCAHSVLAGAAFALGVSSKFFGSPPHLRSAFCLSPSTSESAHASELRMKSVSRFAPSTMASYLRMWAQWKAFCECQAVSAFRPAALNVVDFLHVHSRASAQGLAARYIRAVTWVSKYAGFPVLLSCLQAPLAKSYAVASAPVPRREAAPLPLSFVIWLETCILKSIGTSADRLVMGGILILIWSSLRWIDAQW